MVSSIPRITILMPVYNCEAFIAATLESLLQQTFSDFELLVIDDASTDATVSIIEGFDDSRIHLIVKPENTGYTHSLNRGLTMAKGDYIARMDADDIALPERLAQQVTFMDAHPEVVACGTAYQIMDTSQVVTFPTTHEAIRLRLLEQTCFAHPTVMLRTSVLRAHGLQYVVAKEPAEDYDLWIALSRVGQLANLDTVLLYYRVHDAQVSNTRRARQLASKVDSRILILSDLLPTVKATYGVLLTKVFTGAFLSYAEVDRFRTLVALLLERNVALCAFEADGLCDYLKRLEHKQVKQLLLRPKRFGLKHLMYYWRCHFDGVVSLGFKTSIIVSVKSLIGYRPKKVVL
ncbi:glycosyltransferase [Flavobacteriaceae bacterium 144Ye]|nr:glycosyltransferase [Flavobacteriaceae bacterium 144Ye]